MLKQQTRNQLKLWHDHVYCDNMKLLFELNDNEGLLEYGTFTQLH